MVHLDASAMALGVVVIISNIVIAIIINWLRFYFDGASLFYTSFHK